MAVRSRRPNPSTANWLTARQLPACVIRPPFRRRLRLFPPPVIGRGTTYKLSPCRRLAQLCPRVPHATSPPSGCRAVVVQSVTADRSRKARACVPATQVRRSSRFPDSPSPQESDWSLLKLPPSDCCAALTLSCRVWCRQRPLPAVG